MLQFRAEAGLLGRRMSKLQPAPEVLRSIDARHQPHGRAASCAVVIAWCAVLTAGCLSPGDSDTSTTNVMLSESGTDSGTSAGDTTHAPVMTTTEEPESSSDPGSSSGTSAGTTPMTTTGDTSGDCGDGSIQAPEECDYGPENADDGDCTLSCHKASCGDGKVQTHGSNTEACDDGVNDGAYGGCAEDCSALAPHCGDGDIQEKEACDQADPREGCLPDTCQYAQSCKQIRDAFIMDEQLADGVYTIKPADKPTVKVLCDMNADGGGYTFLKIAVPEMSADLSASKAESKCAEYGMRLLVPRSPMHVVAATLAAKSVLLDPLGGGTTKGSIGYLKILGVYPVTAGESCVGKALNSVACPEWAADSGPYWVTDTKFTGQPALTNCAGCSMEYYWTESGMLTGIEAYSAGGSGAKAAMFMCDTGDKLMPE